jgi:hypothetical protein
MKPAARGHHRMLRRRLCRCTHPVLSHFASVDAMHVRGRRESSASPTRQHNILFFRSFANLNPWPFLFVPTGAAPTLAHLAPLFGHVTLQGFALGNMASHPDWAGPYAEHGLRDAGNVLLLGSQDNRLLKVAMASRHEVRRRAQSLLCNPADPFCSLRCR